MIDACADHEGAAGAILFENADWRVFADGLEHRRTGYFIARDSLAMRRDQGLWAWPLQLSEKSWCTPRPFREAFLAAVGLFEVAHDGLLAASFAIAFGHRAGQGGTAQDGFVALGELVRPKLAMRTRATASPARRGGAAPTVAAPRAAEPGRHRASAM